MSDDIESDKEAARPGEQENRGSPRELLRLFAYVRPYRARIAIAVACLVLAGALGLAFPQVVRLLIDAAFVEKDQDRLNTLAILLVVVFAVQAAFSFVRSYLLSSTGEKVVADVRTDLYAHLIYLPASFYANRRVGELTSRLSSDVTIIQTVTTGSFAEMLRLSLTLVGGITIIAVTNLRLTLLMLAIVPVIILSANLYGRYIRKLSTRVQDELAEANTVLEETLSAIRIVQSFVREEFERARFGSKIHLALGLAIRRSLAGAGFIAFIILIVFGAIAVVLWFGSRLVLTGEMTAGELIAFVLYTFVVSGAIGGMSELYGQFQQAIGATRRVFELIDTRPDIKDPDSPQPFDKVEGHIEIRNVSFQYPGDRPVEILKDISIRVTPGEVIALVGPSGAGKSTLVALIPRFYDVSGGAILIDGKDIRSLKLRDLRGSIGVVPQETTLFGGTIRENIAYGKLEATGEEIEAVARAAHAHEFIEELPDRYGTIVGERGIKLSGGQRQRIAIARALLKDPRILILDEATSSLDSESERLVQEALETLMTGRTTFVIAHRLSTVRKADRIVVLNQGRVIEEGTHPELMTARGLYKQLYEIQFREQPTQDSMLTRAEA
jgi:subfamily B ATP-binding cassette protein MsbA